MQLLYTICGLPLQSVHEQLASNSNCLLFVKIFWRLRLAISWDYPRWLRPRQGLCARDSLWN